MGAILGPFPEFFLKNKLIKLEVSNSDVELCYTDDYGGFTLLLGEWNRRKISESADWTFPH